MTILHLLTQRIIVQAEIGKDESGDPVYGTPLIFPARVELDQRMVFDNNGKETSSSHRIMTMKQMPNEARIWLPDADTKDVTQARKILQTKSASIPGSYALYETRV